MFGVFLIPVIKGRREVRLGCGISVESGRGNILRGLKVAFMFLRRKCFVEGNCFWAASYLSPPNYEWRDTSMEEWMKQKE